MAYQKYIEFHFNHKARWKWVQYIYTVAPKSWKYARNERKKTGSTNPEKKTPHKSNRLHRKNKYKHQTRQIYY